MKNKSLINIGSLFLICLLLLGNPVECGVLHTILVGDTTEGEISYGTECGMDLMHRSMRRTAAHIELDLTVAYFEGFHANEPNLCFYIEKMDVASDDIVLIYFQMHGERDAHKLSKWPDLIFRIENKRLDFGMFIEKLQMKNPRLLLAIADSCNSYRGEELPSASDSDKEKIEMSKSALEQLLAMEKYKGPSFSYALSHAEMDPVFFNVEDEVVEAYRKLFLEHSGSILISSSSPGEDALRDGFVSGGIFTRRYLESLRTLTCQTFVINKTEVSWPKLLEETQTRMKTDCEKNYSYLEGFLLPTPQYELHLY